MSELAKGPIVGIDLGTTNSVVAAVINGRPEVLSDDGEAILPSVVGVDPQGKLITGTVARNQQVAFPERTIVSIKRHMGQMDKVNLGEQQFTPPEVSAMILRKLRDRASRVLGTPVSRAVITVPAFFDENQRQATREAGELAGLTVERIINEPTAASLVYHAGADHKQHLVVYDFGGGTFDVSVVRMEAGVIEVLSSKGDTHLGGDDLDALLLKYVADIFISKHEIDLRTNASTRWRLLQACERAKRELSTEATTTISEEFIAEKAGQPLHLNVTITRRDYEGLIEHLVEKTIDCVDDALRDAKLNMNQIDELVLVGGSTRTPLVQERLREEFKLEPSRAVDPDLAVALGAAVQAAMLEGQKVGRVLIDVTGHTLGIAALSGSSMFGSQAHFSPIIHRNTPLPATYEQAYFKNSEGQTVAEIDVYQGEHNDLALNQSIGIFKVDVEAGGGEKNRIVVRFDLTLDGVLNVTALQPATGKKNDLKINNALSNFQEHDRELAKDRLSTMFIESDELADDDEFNRPADWIRRDSPDTAVPTPQSGAAGKAAALIGQARQIANTVGGDDSEELRSLADQLEAAISSADDAQIESLSAALDDVLFYVQ